MAKKKSSLFSQKGFSPLIIVAILAVIAVGIFVFYNSKNSKISSSNQISQETQLEKTETKYYTFYYPKGYLFSHNEVSSYTELFYSAPDNNQEYEDTSLGIRLDIQPLLQRNGIPSLEFCKNIVESTYKGATVIKADSVDYAEAHGCEFIISHNIEDKNLKDMGIVHGKYLWWKEKNDLSVVSSIAVYFNSTPQAEQKSLNLAVESFTLK